MIDMIDIIDIIVKYINVLLYYLNIIPHLPRHIWNILWIREDEFHKSLNMDVSLLLSLNDRHKEIYIINLEKRRRKAHERSNERRDRINQKG